MPLPFEPFHNIAVGKPEDLPPPLIPSVKPVSLERFAGPKEDLYTAVSKPLKKKPEPVKSGSTSSSYTKLSDLNVTNNPAAVAATTTTTTAPVVNEQVTCVSSQQSYSEVAFDQRPELEPASKRESATDDDMWVTVKWRQQQEMMQRQQQQQEQQQQHAELERSMEDDAEAVALSLLGGGGSHHTEHIPTEDYSNLADINTGQAFVGEVKRTEQDSNKIYIDSNDIINGDNSIPSHDYVNHDTDDGKEEKQGMLKLLSAATYSEIDNVNQIAKKINETKRQRNGSPATVPPMSDYVNTTPSPPQV